MNFDVLQSGQTSPSVIMLGRQEIKTSFSRDGCRATVASGVECFRKI